MAADAEDAFQKELIELFVQEAHEWLQQIHVALDELQQGPAPDRHLKLAQTIKAGIANLGGSAATISLGDVERASFAALPFIEAVQDPAARISANDFIALCKQLGHIHTALTRATGVTFEAGGAEAVDALPVTIPASDLLSALQVLQQRQVASKVSSRNLVATVVAQVQGLLRNGVTQCDVTSMNDFLDRLAEADEGFVATVQQQLPRVTEGIARLKQDAAQPAGCSERLPALQEQVAQLWTAAQQVNAAAAMTFFMGLHSFLAVVAQRRVAIAAKRFEAVEGRLRTVMFTIQTWIDNGRAERSAIASLLPAQSA
jgi:chemotaxis protein histidine kinase CheA